MRIAANACPVMPPMGFLWFPAGKRASCSRAMSPILVRPRYLYQGDRVRNRMAVGRRANGPGQESGPGGAEPVPRESSPPDNRVEIHD